MDRKISSPFDTVVQHFAVLQAFSRCQVRRPTANRFLRHCIADARSNLRRINFAMSHTGTFDTGPGQRLASDHKPLTDLSSLLHPWIRVRVNPPLTPSEPPDALAQKHHQRKIKEVRPQTKGSFRGFHLKHGHYSRVGSAKIGFELGALFRLVFETGFSFGRR